MEGLLKTTVKLPEADLFYCNSADYHFSLIGFEVGKFYQFIFVIHFALGNFSNQM